MAKKLNDVYLQQNHAPDADKVMVEGEPVKKKKAPSSKWQKFRPVAIFLISLAIVAGLVYGAYHYVRGHYFDPVDVEDTTPVEVKIEPGSSLNTISEILYDKGLIQNKQVFKLYVDFSDMSSKLRAGTYTLSKDMDFDDIIYALQKGKGDVSEVRVRFVEGLSVEDYFNTLVESGFFDQSSEYMELVTTGEAFTDYDFIADVVEENDASGEKRKYAMEGYLFPDTYDFYTSASPADTINRQLARFNEIFTDDYKARAQELGMSVDDVVTLASVIEKEAKKDDFKKVSAVFHNRLREDMQLDSDATLAYVLGVKKFIFTSEQLATDSLYNTRKYPGLPLGPICNPSKAAIEAALYPEEDFEDYYYFTLVNPDTGELVFTKTLEDHQAEVDKYYHLYEEADAAAAANAS